MTVHVFQNYCVDWETLLAQANIDNMMKVVEKQSKTEEAKMNVDFANYKDYDAKTSCPAYYGMFLEWLCGHFLNHFGHNFNIESTTMNDVVGGAVKDYGIDGVARTIKKTNQKEFISTGRMPVQGSPVYIQVKATRKRDKMFEANDGSRLPNFMTNAQMTAMKAKKSYQARYVLFTTGKGVYHTLEEMSGKLMEVINYELIKTHMKNNVVFLNILRKAAGLTEFPLLDSPIDQDAPIFEEEQETETT